jgi:DNA primase
MDISPTIIKEYLLEKFEDYHVAHDEFLVDSLFVEDSGKHMSINMETGLWQCFKSKEQGNFIHLISFVEDISYGEARKVLGRKLFDTPESLFSEIQIYKQKEIPQDAIPISKVKSQFKKLDFSEESTSLSESLAKKFIRSRKLTSCDFYIAKEGKYINRLIIPYEDSEGMFYFQARNLTSFGMKYLNPTFKEYGVKSSEILFPFDESETYVMVTEGPLDALSLRSIGVNATCIQGSHLSSSQASLLKGRKIILSFDNDDPGREGMGKAVKVLASKNIPAPYVVQPPERFKDWNDFLVVGSKRELLTHINTNVHKLDYMHEVISLLS